MNLQDFVLDTPDDFVGSIFGNKDQLKVEARILKETTAIKYLVKCAICCLDEELFGEGYFSISKGHLKDGKYPCGCSSLPKWSKEQTLIKIGRVLSGTHYTFIRTDGNWNATRSRIVCSCDMHGEQPSQSVMDVLSGRKCRECRVVATTKANSISDDVHISNFKNTGMYHPETTFWRSEKKTPHKKYREGVSLHWWVCCGECKLTVETLFTTLKQGGLSCECSSYNQKLSYIHLIKDSETSVALKFGISNDVHRRFMGQQNKTQLTMENLGVWEFEDSISCKNAERVLKNTIPCGILNKESFPDGHSETTYLNQIDTIIKIYENHGGVQISAN